MSSTEPSGRRNSNTELLQELEALSQSLYQSHTARRTASLILPRSAPNGPEASPAMAPSAADDTRVDSRPRSRRMSMSPWRSRPKQVDEDDADHHRPPAKSRPTSGSETAVVEEKTGIWSWKPMRALSHIAMRRLGCLFSVEVIAIQGLPASMNGLRLSVAVRKKDTKDGAVQTMPARVLQGAADFEETLFIRCHLYCSGGAGTGKPVKFEPRPFLISAVAVDAPELDFGKSAADLSLLVKESMEKNLQEGARVRQWEKGFRLSGKAKGGELVVKLGFQIMEDGGLGIYSQGGGLQEKAGSRGKGMSSPAIARKQSKSSFSVTSPRTPTRTESYATTPSKEVPSAINFNEIDDFKLDEPAPPPSPPAPAQKVETVVEAKAEDLDLPEFEIVDKGIEIQDEEEKENEGAGGAEEEEAANAGDEKSVSSDVVVVKEVVHDEVHQRRLNELDSIAEQIKALESMMAGDEAKATSPATHSNNVLDAEEETVTKEFLQLLEMEGGEEFRFNFTDQASPKSGRKADSGEATAAAFVSDLGKGLGAVVQTKDGGYLAAANPLDVEVHRKATPKLAIQISKPIVLRDQSAASGFEIFQRMAAMGPEDLGTALLSVVSMDELTGKTAEQIAFEGIASAIITGRNKDVASSSLAARSVAALKEMGAAMEAGRKERVATGIWNVQQEEPVTAEEILGFALQKVESMAVEALKIQADMAEEEAPFDVFTLAGKEDPNPPLASVVALDEWVASATESGAPDNVTILLVVQLRDPLRRYECIGGPVVGLVQSARAGGGGGKGEEERYKVGSLHVAGMKVAAGGGGKRSGFDGERQRLTAAQWLVAYGLGKAGRKRGAQGKGGQDLLWSLSSRVMADMWLKATRNPDVKFPKEP